MMRAKLENIPTNLVMGFLGVGKTTAILHLLKQKPKHENWAVLVNEFGQIGIDGAVYAAAGATVKEIPGGCLCCAVGLPFQVGVNQMLRQTRPDRLLIEPSGLGHPKQVIDMLIQGWFKEVLDLRANICLLDPEKLKNPRYTSHDCFMDQIALSDVLVANKTDLADHAAIRLFHQAAEYSVLKKAVIAQTVQGQLDAAWLNIQRNPERIACFPNAHRSSKTTGAETNQTSVDVDQSSSHVFLPDVCFDYQQLIHTIRQFEIQRLKGMVFTNAGWIMINCVDGLVEATPCSMISNSRIEIIANRQQLQDISTAINQCRLTDSRHLV